MIYDYESPFGAMTVRIEKGFVTGLWFVGQKYYPENMSARGDDKRDDEENQATWESFVDQMTAYERGTLREFSLPLAPGGTDFQQAVWALLLKIPYGETMTYGQLSRLVAASYGQASMSAQAIGGAVGRNPISLVIPCHRVLGAGSKLTGYAGGLDKKAALLSHEGAPYQIVH